MKKIVFAILFLSGLYVQAQDFLGYSASEYAGVTAIDIQPANLADNRFRFDMTLGGLSLKAYNNYVGIKRYGLKGLSSGHPAMADTGLKGNQMKDNYIETYDGGKPKSLYFSNRIVLPSFLVEINHKNTIAFTWDVRNYVNVDNVSPELARLLYLDEKDTALVKKNLHVSNLSVQAMSWAEYGVTWAHVLKEDNQHAWKVAGRAKIIQGVAAAYLYVKDFNYQFPSDTTLNIMDASVNYGHSNNLYVNQANQLKYKFVSSPGFGVDLGVVYEWRPDFEKYKYDMDGQTGLWRRDKSKYKLKAGLSVLDLGGVKFGKGEFSNDFKANVNFWEFRKLKFDSLPPLQSFDDTIRKKFPTNNSKRSFFMNLPTALSAQVDYKIWKDFDINFIAYYAFQFKNKEHKVHDFTSISITPAWDHKWFGVFVPVQYHMLYGFAYGACVRLGPVIMGTDNLGAIFGNQSFKGADFYFMLKVPIPFGPPKDRDKDKVSNKKDKCRDVPGTWEFMGCPDRDGDHIPDSEDKCPDVAGPKEMKGCPDKDGDGITDLEDACPDDKGIVEFKGCPDRDGDKIIDKDDECPDDAGLAEFMGCPDKDGDKVIDKVDLCPDLPGPVEYKGCPDKDGDTVLDKDDGCPEIAGPVENKGCPWPDSDKDGVADREDDCPNVEGTKELKGCPPIKVEEQKIIEKAFANLEFATGKDIIKKTSYPSLTDLAKLLKEHTGDWMLKLSGHTDNQGAPEKNMLLSQKRAEAVKKYLVSKGEKADKVVVEWFGQTKPIESNDTEAGRQKNRRVEMKIIIKK